MGMIVTLLMVITIYNIIDSNYIFERANGKKIDFRTYSNKQWEIWGLTYYNEDYLLFEDLDDWENFVNNSLRTFHSDYGNLNETQILNIIEQNKQYLNFSKYTYFGAFYGSKSNTGYWIEIKELILKKSQLKIFIKKSEPEPFTFTGQAITFPHHVIYLEKHDIPKNVTFSVKFLGEDVHLIFCLGILISVLIFLVILVMLEKRSKKLE